MKTFISAALISLLIMTNSLALEPLVTTKSNHSVQQTADKFSQLVEDKGLRLFSRIDHAANAKSADLELPATQVIVFGNPNVGTKLMQCAPTIAIDLPQKALVWEDQEGSVFLSYNNPAFLKEVHKVEGCEPIFEKITGLLAGLAASATQ